MRDIRFRAWHNKLKIMLPVRTIDVYGSVVCFVLDNETYLKFKDSEWGAWAPSEVAFGQPPPENVELMQFTGLFDKHGKEIYEGDILQHQYKGKGQVIYEAPGFRVVEDDLDVWLGHTDKKKRKVIGNIYENPELVTNTRP